MVFFSCRSFFIEFFLKFTVLALKNRLLVDAGPKMQIEYAWFRFYNIEFWTQFALYQNVEVRCSKKWILVPKTDFFGNEFGSRQFISTVAIKALSWEI